MAKSDRDVIRDRIASLGLRQVEVARRAKLTQSQLSEYLTGKRGLPVESLRRLAGALGLELELTLKREREKR